MAGVNLNESPSKFNNPYSSHSHGFNPDERTLSGTGHYDVTLARSEFDIEEDFDEVTEAKEDKHELNEVVRNYQRILSGIIEEPNEEL